MLAGFFFAGVFFFAGTFFFAAAFFVLAFGLLAALRFAAIGLSVTSGGSKNSGEPYQIVSTSPSEFAMPLKL